MGRSCMVGDGSILKGALPIWRGERVKEEYRK